MTTTDLINRRGTLLAPQLDYILLDGSGSMQSKWWDTLAGLQNFLSVLRAQNIASHGIVHLFDTVNLMVRRLAELDPPRCSIVIITDGMENGSTHTTAAQARNLLDWCRH